MRPYCVFCNIVAGNEPANVLYQDDEIIVIQNILRWAPIMLLAMTKEHR
ncbi:MAG: histidine triad nucleotide-binding protein, partial [Anaerolineales bacterium]